MEQKLGTLPTQNIHRLIAVLVKREMQGAEGAGVVELREIDLFGKVGGAPIALLGGVPAMARVATKRNKQQISLVKRRLQARWNLLIKRSSECDNNGVVAFKQVVQNLFFEWGVKATDDNFVGLADGFGPLQRQLRVVWRCFPRSEECHQSSIEQVLISG